MMSSRVLYLVIGLLLAVMAAAWLWHLWQRRRGVLRVRHFAFPAGWLAVLERNVPLYHRLPMDLRDRLQDRILNFVDGKRWKHCGGLEAVTDEMKVTIAGQACFLLLNRDYGRNFSRVLNVMVYPAASLDNGAESVLPPMEAWPSSSVLLAWDEATKSARDLRDERNEVRQEFARQLDLTAGPGVQDHCRHTAWGRVMSKEFLQQEAARSGRVPLEVLLPGGDPAEVFAAATELFFEQPEPLRQRHAPLYGKLRDFYKLDPARWLNR